LGKKERESKTLILFYQRRQNWFTATSLYACDTVVADAHISVSKRKKKELRPVLVNGESDNELQPSLIRVDFMLN
jgi:hypothetical protein